MTLTASVRVPFSRAIANLRDWDLPGVEAVMVELSQRHNDPGECLELMLAWARRGDARTPAGVLKQIPRTAPERPAATPTPASQSVWCERHGCNAKVRLDGELSCCWQERLEGEPEPYLRAAVSAPPADFRERVEAAKEGHGNG